MANLTRAKNNWEAKFSNITYSDALEIAKNKNIREILVSRKIGISEENFSIFNNDVLKFDVRAYDNSKLKNANIFVTEGRLPSKQNEIIISMLYKDEGRFEKKIELGSTLSLTCNGQTEEYIVVGKTNELEFDERNFSGTILGAITFLDSNNLKSEAIVDVAILTNNVKNIYKTTEEIASKLEAGKYKEEITDEELAEAVLKAIELNSQNMNNIEENEGINIETNEKLYKYFYEGKDEYKNNKAILEYNDELLNYALIFNNNTDFSKMIITFASFAIFVTTIVSVVMLFTSLKITYKERIRDLGMLSSIGLDKKQKNAMIKKEIKMLGSIRNNFRNVNWNCNFFCAD